MKDVDSIKKSQYLKLAISFFSALFIIIAIAGRDILFLLQRDFGIQLFGGMYTLLIIIILISLTFPLPLMFFIELIGEFVGYVYEGRGSGTTLHEQLTAELVKVRHLKTQDKFQDALKSINAILEQMPEHPDALLLKAQILWEGFQDHAFAKRCLRKVLQAKSSADDTVRQWASGLLDEIESRQI